MKELTNSEKRLAQYLGKDEIALIQTFVDKTFVTDEVKMTAATIHEHLKDELDREDLSKENFCGSLSCNVRGGYVVGIQGKRKVGYMRTVRNEPIVKTEVALKIIRGRKSRTKAAIPTPVPPAEPVSSVPPSGDLEVIEAPVKLSPAEQIAQLAAEYENRVKPEVKKSFGSEVMEHQRKPIFQHPRHVWIDGEELLVSMLMSNIKKLVFHVLSGKLDEKGTVVFDGDVYSVPDTKILRNFLTEMYGAQSKGQSEPVLNDDTGIPVELRITG